MHKEVSLTCSLGVVWAHSMLQISFTSNFFQIFSLETNFLTCAPESQPELRNLTGYLAIRLSGLRALSILIRIIGNLFSLWNSQSDRVTWILVCRSEIISPVKIFRRMWLRSAAWIELKPRFKRLTSLSNYLQTAGKKNLLMHNCEGEFCWIFLALESRVHESSPW